MNHHHTPLPDGMATLIELVSGVSDPTAAALVVSAATSGAIAALAAYRAGEAKQAAPVNDRAKYSPHPLDVLVIAVLREGAKDRAIIVAEVEGEQYPSRGRKIAAKMSNIKKRVDALAKCGVIESTAAGYVIADEAIADRLDDTDFGE